MIVANAKLQIFGDLPKGLSPFLSAQFNFLSDTNNSKWDLETWDALGSWENPKLLIETRRGVFRIVFPSGTSFSDFVPGYSSFEDDAVEISIGGLWNYKENCNYVSGSALVMTNDGEKMKVRFNNYSFSFQEGRMIIFDGTLIFVVNKYFP